MRDPFADTPEALSRLARDLSTAGAKEEFLLVDSRR